MRNILSTSTVLLALVASACDGGVDPIGLQGTGLPPVNGSGPSIGLAVSGALSVSRGASGRVMVTVERVTDFNGIVSLSAEGLPAGVTAVFAPPTVPNTTTAAITLTVTAATTAALGTVRAAIHARASGVGDAIVQLDLDVTP